jgi:hypothetical protein
MPITNYIEEFLVPQKTSDSYSCASTEIIALNMFEHRYILGSAKSISVQDISLYSISY